MMNLNNIYTQFSEVESQRLTSVQDDERYAVMSIPETNHFIGMSREGYPMVFINTSDSEMFPSIRMEILSIKYNTNCTIFSDHEQLANLSIITLLSSNCYIQKWFLDIMGLIIEKIAEHPTTMELSEEITYLLDIFQKISNKSKKTIQGLWSELLIIEQSNDPQFLLDAWHRDKGAKFDFSTDSDKLEVKSTVKETREHAFSLGQLNPSENTRIVVVSVLVAESDSVTGCSTMDLIDKIGPRIGSESHAKLIEVALDTMGQDFEQIYDEKFSYTTGIDELKFYDSEFVPKIEKKNVPDKVSSVKFVSNLEGIQNIEDWSNYDNSELYKRIHD